MTYRELFGYSKKLLSEGDIESAVYDTYCLCSHFLNADRMKLISLADTEPPLHDQEEFINAVNKRLGGYPLQYILGKWSFMDRDFIVGEGVLIPRDDTEVCVRECIKALKGTKTPRIADLCSGSGIIAVTLAKAFPQSKVIAMELSDKALGFLRTNIELNSADNVDVVKCDILKDYEMFSCNSFDALISNPPYIMSHIISKLQPEIQYEPRLALDGGEDGLVFYRSIAQHWIPRLKKNGFICVEIGEEQAQGVSSLFRENGIDNIKVIKDIQNLDRVIFGTKK